MPVCVYIVKSIHLTIKGPSGGNRKILNLYTYNNIHKNSHKRNRVVIEGK